MRTFIAVPLPQECQSMLEELQRGLRPLGADVRWVAVPSIHLTLKFLGEMDPEAVPRLTEPLRGASTFEHAFTLRLHGLGCFPNQRNPRVIWCGVDGDTDRLESLHKKVEKVCADLGFPSEGRLFQPHLTLGRMRGKRNLQRLLDYIKIGSELECSFKVDHFNLYKSTLTPQGAIYTILETIALLQ